MLKKINFCARSLLAELYRVIFLARPPMQLTLQSMPPLAFIDDFTSKDAFAGLPVIKLNAVPDGAIIVSGIVDGRPVTVNRLLSNRGFDNIDYFSFLKYSGLNITKRAMVSHEIFRKCYADNKAEFTNVFDRLEDDISRETFSRLMKLRLNDDISVMEYFTFRPQDIYFEPPVQLTAGNEVFVDVGSFDGETTLDFIRRCPHYHSIHIFEPEPQQMAAIKAKLKNIRGIHYHQCGASDKNETLKFTSSGIESHVDADGDIAIEVDKIDARVSDKTTFIKMDIEGHEIYAIAGSRQRILADHPALAICAYHRADDYWKIPQAVFAIRDDYQLYMRHYTEGVLETVYYFIPK